MLSVFRASSTYQQDVTSGTINIKRQSEKGVCGRERLGYTSFFPFSRSLSFGGNYYCYSARRR